MRMLGKSKLGLIVLAAILLTSISLATVSAQYATEATTNVAITSNGTFIASDTTTGVTYDITGAPGATGTVTTDLYNGNPQSSATIPNGISMTHFVVITFNMNAQDFTTASITITYSASDVQNLKMPYAIYKWDSTSNTYVALPSTIDTTAKTITVNINSINDPLLAIGGASVAASSGGAGISTITVAVLIVSVIVILIVAVFTVRIFRKPAEFSLQKN